MKHLIKLCDKYDEQIIKCFTGTDDQREIARQKVRTLEARIKRNKLWYERISDMKTMSILRYRGLIKSNKFT